MSASMTVIAHHYAVTAAVSERAAISVALARTAQASPRAATAGSASQSIDAEQFERARRQADLDTDE